MFNPARASKRPNALDINKYLMTPKSSRVLSTDGSKYSSQFESAIAHIMGGLKARKFNCSLDRNAKTSFSDCITLWAVSILYINNRQWDPHGHCLRKGHDWGKKGLGGLDCVFRGFGRTAAIGCYDDFDSCILCTIFCWWDVNNLHYTNDVMHTPCWAWHPTSFAQSLGLSCYTPVSKVRTN